MRDSQFLYFQYIFLTQLQLQISRVSTEMKMARAASAVQFIASKNVGANDANLFDKTEIQDLYEWLKSISLHEYLPVLIKIFLVIIIFEETVNEINKCLHKWSMT